MQPAAGSERADLTWLLHRAAQRMRAGLDEVARAHGLPGVREWIVLTAIGTGPRQTQLALGRSLGLDKTTLTSLLDRLEADGLVTRGLDTRDRRARIPLLTEAGREVQRKVAAARDRAEASLLAAFSAQEQRLLRDLLTRLASGQPSGYPDAGGSCT
jgi:DNA-binding MarR family transcriptional regulator